MAEYVHNNEQHSTTPEAESLASSRFTVSSEEEDEAHE
jgi:hypothetical protein